MIMMLARRQYVYQFSEEMLTDVKFIDVQEHHESFEELAEKMDYIVVMKGGVTVNEKISPILTVQDFADLYFALEKNVSSEEEFARRSDLVRTHLSLYAEK